jgi:hypothetical protein
VPAVCATVGVAGELPGEGIEPLAGLLVGADPVQVDHGSLDARDDGLGPDELLALAVHRGVGQVHRSLHVGQQGDQAGPFGPVLVPGRLGGSQVAWVT